MNGSKQELQLRSHTSAAPGVVTDLWLINTALQLAAPRVYSTGVLCSLPFLDATSPSGLPVE